MKDYCLINSIIAANMILIVDDKAENIFSLKRTLEFNGFEVDTADSGEEALKKILKNSYSLIILDVQMPGMDGFEVAEALSGYSKAADIPIIFLSAVNTDKKFITKGYTSGGVDYIVKPVDPDIFILKVKTLNRLYEQNRELNRVRLYLLEEVEVRKQAEKTLVKTMKEHRSILESIPQIAFTLTPDGEIEFVNEHWYIYSDDAGRMPQFHDEDHKASEGFMKALETGSVFVAEVRIRNKYSGAFRYHLLKMIPVKQGIVVVKWVGTFTDIQEQKAANENLEIKVRERTEELLKKNRQLETSNHELQQFASVASHDLKEPLRKIQVFSSIVRDRFLNNTPASFHHLDRVIEASQKMSELINDLLDYSRLSMNALYKDTDLTELVAEVVNNLEFSITEKNASVTVGEMPTIAVIPGQIRQVFQNLISNSLKFSRKDVHPVISISSECTDNLPDDICTLIVQDNGIGFDEKYLDKIFTIFQRLNAKEDYEGTGIGLAIVKKIVEKHSGTITARSIQGQGAKFIITLPVRQPLNSEANTTDIPTEI